MVDKCMLDLRSIIQNNKNDEKWQNYDKGSQNAKFSKSPCSSKTKRITKVLFAPPYVLQKSRRVNPKQFCSSVCSFRDTREKRRKMKILYSSINY